MLIRVIDFETSGMHDEPDDEGPHQVCEVGWCDVAVNDGIDITVDPGGPHSILCHPGRSIPPEARAVHHISDKEMAAVTFAPDYAFTRLLAEGKPDILCAHNIDFEKAFFDGAGARWICTYKTGVRIWKDAPAHSNQVLRYWLGLELDEEKAMPPHRAGPDAYVTACILAKILEDGLASIQEMLRWATGPALLPRVNFGKHRGSTWEELPTDYLEWIINKSEMSNEIKANARYHLKLRRQAA